MGRLDGKVAAVTAGASGIGEATVRRFVAEGASVAFCDRDGECGQRVAAELETAGAKVAFVQADVGTEAACLDFVNGAAQKFGRLDCPIPRLQQLCRLDLKDRCELGDDLQARIARAFLQLAQIGAVDGRRVRENRGTIRYRSGFLVGWRIHPSQPALRRPSSICS